MPIYEITQNNEQEDFQSNSISSQNEPLNSYSHPEKSSKIEAEFLETKTVHCKSKREFCLINIDTNKRLIDIQLQTPSSDKLGDNNSCQLGRSIQFTKDHRSLQVSSDCQGEYEIESINLNLINSFIQHQEGNNLQLLETRFNEVTNNIRDISEIEIPSDIVYSEFLDTIIPLGSFSFNPLGCEEGAKNIIGLKIEIPSDSLLLDYKLTEQFFRSNDIDHLNILLVDRKGTILVPSQHFAESRLYTQALDDSSIPFASQSLQKNSTTSNHYAQKFYETGLVVVQSDLIDDSNPIPLSPRESDSLVQLEQSEIFFSTSDYAEVPTQLHYLSSDAELAYPVLSTTSPIYEPELVVVQSDSLEQLQPSEIFSSPGDAEVPTQLHYLSSDTELADPGLPTSLIKNQKSYQVGIPKNTMYFLHQAMLKCQHNYTIYHQIQN